MLTVSDLLILLIILSLLIKYLSVPQQFLGQLNKKRNKSKNLTKEETTGRLFGKRWFTKHGNKTKLWRFAENAVDIQV